MTEDRKRRRDAARISAIIRIAREHPELDDLAVEALAIVQTAPRVPPDPGDEMPIDHPGYDTVDQQKAIRQMTSDALWGRHRAAVDVELAATEWWYRRHQTGDASLDDDERKVVLRYVRQARHLALDHIADMRASRLGGLVPPDMADIDEEGRDLIRGYAERRIGLPDVLYGLGLTDVDAVWNRVYTRRLRPGPQTEAQMLASTPSDDLDIDV